MKVFITGSNVYADVTCALVGLEGDACNAQACQAGISPAFYMSYCKPCPSNPECYCVPDPTCDSSSPNFDIFDPTQGLATCTDCSPEVCDNCAAASSSNPCAPEPVELSLPCSVIKEVPCPEIAAFP